MLVVKEAKGPGLFVPCDGLLSCLRCIPPHPPTLTLIRDEQNGPGCWCDLNRHAQKQPDSLFPTQSNDDFIQTDGSKTLVLPHKDGPICSLSTTLSLRCVCFQHYQRRRSHEEPTSTSTLLFFTSFLKLPRLPFLFCLILVICCQSKIWGSFIYSADFTQKHLAVPLNSIIHCIKTSSKVCSLLWVQKWHDSQKWSRKSILMVKTLAFQVEDASWHLLIISTYCGAHRESLVWIPPSIESTWPAALTYISPTGYTHAVMHCSGGIYAPDELRYNRINTLHWSVIYGLMVQLP